MKNAEVEKICHWSTLVGQLGWSKNSHSHLKLILCCSLPDVIPHIKFHLNLMKKTKVQIFETFDPLILFANLPKLKYHSAQIKWDIIQVIRFISLRCMINNNSFNKMIIIH